MDTLTATARLLILFAAVGAAALASWAIVDTAARAARTQLRGLK